MKQQNKIFQVINILTGVITLSGLTFDFILFANVKEIMINFLPLTQLQENLITVAGFSLLIMLGFFIWSLLQLVTTIRYSESLKFLLVLLFVAGMVALLMVFADIALLSDIAKQYKAGLEQPEWLLLYSILIPQGVVVLAFTILHVTGYLKPRQTKQITVDSNIFLIVQYTGLLCGVMGLAFTILGFIFSHGWSLLMHTIMTNLILLIPYGLALLYWILVNAKERNQPLFDEKQRQDVGQSAFVTLIIVSAAMTLIFALNVHTLDGALSYQWLPIYLFSSVLVFSVGNLYFNSKA